jgi:hypothetical protein
MKKSTLIIFIFFILVVITTLYILDNDCYSNIIKFFFLLFKFAVIYLIYLLLFNNNKIEVLQDKPNPEKAADIIKKVNDNLDKLIKYLNNKYTDEKIDIIHNNVINFNKKKFIRKVVKELNSNYSNNIIKEHFPDVHSVNTSFNVNKGDEIHLCLRNFLTDNFHCFNDIMFVSIHELAHCCYHSPGHKKDFWIIFRFLLENANEINIYEKINYKKNPFYYCSTKVTYNPIFDNKLDDDKYFK